jgi:CHAT domain-containing protein
MKNITQIINLGLLFFCLSIFGQDNSEPERIINAYNKSGYLYLKEGNFDSAEYYLLKTLELQVAYLGRFHSETASTHVNLSVIYRNLNNFQEALRHLNIAEKFFVENEPNSMFLGYIYNNKGNIYYSFSDFREAELYYRYCLDFFAENNPTNPDAYADPYFNLFNILIAQGRIEEAISFLNDLNIVNVSKKLEFNKHLYLAEAYSRLEKLDRALYEVNIAKGIYDEHLSNIPYLMTYNYRVASINVKKGNYDLALRYLMHNIRIVENTRATSFEKLYQTFLLIGNIHYLKGNYENCIAWLSSTINKLSDIDTNEDATNNILNARSYNRDIIDFFKLYADAAQKLYYKNNDIDYLLLSLENYSRSIDYLKVFRLHMRNPESIHLESQTRISIIHEAVDVASKLYNLTGDLKYLEKAFLYAENMKAFSLYSEIKSGEAMQFAGLPTEVRERENTLTRKIEAYNELIHEENARSTPNQNLIKNYNESFFKLKDNYNSLLDSIEKYYPKYFELKYNPNFITPKVAQKKLRRKECLVEYVLSDSILTTFVIDEENINVLTRNIEDDFPDKCFAYFDLLQNQDFSNNVRETYREYVTLGKMFYEILVEPVLEITESREITFVPDGAIMYLPFESFITEDVDKEYINYRDLPYLIYDISVGYSHSSTLLFSERIKTKSPLEKVLAFAPEYENLLDGDVPLVWNRQSNPDFLMPLPGAKREVENISKTVPSDVYLDYEATENNFKLHASDYEVLHLAMHTIMDDENPMFSKLAFARNWSDTTQDHNLFTYEIYNMKLNAEMVVLSSCSSGYGKMQKGEGMMSMARGFIYAGCPSIVMTLWQVSDHSSADLMSGFYRYLKSGKSKKKALREAKIDYIRSSDKLKANPYFWSAFMMVGDSSPLYGASAGLYFTIIITGFAFVVIFLSYKKQIKRAVKQKKR